MDRNDVNIVSKNGTGDRNKKATSAHPKKETNPQERTGRDKTQTKQNAPVSSENTRSRSAPGQPIVVIQWGEFDDPGLEKCRSAQFEKINGTSTVRKETFSLSVCVVPLRH